MKKMFGSSLLLLLVFVAAACGGDDDGTESDDTTTTTAPAETTTTTVVANTTTTTTGGGAGPAGTTVPPGGSESAEAAALNVLSFCNSVDSLGPFLEAEGSLGEFGRAAYDALVPAAETIANDSVIQGDPDLAAQANECLETFEAIEID